MFWVWLLLCSWWSLLGRWVCYVVCKNDVCKILEHLVEVVCRWYLPKCTIYKEHIWGWWYWWWLLSVHWVGEFIGNFGKWNCVALITRCNWFLHRVTWIGRSIKSPRVSLTTVDMEIFRSPLWFDFHVDGDREKKLGITRNDRERHSLNNHDDMMMIIVRSSSKAAESVDAGQTDKTQSSAQMMMVRLWGGF